MKARLLPVLLLLGMSIFLFTRAGQSGTDVVAEDVHVVEGAVATFDISTGSGGTTTRPITVTAYLVTLADRPQNVTFRLSTLPEAGIAPGARVRLEILDDPQEEFTRARNYPDGSYEVRAVGATVDGQVLYTAAAAEERTDSSSTASLLGAIACLVLGLGWAGFVGYRWRATIRAALEERIFDWPGRSP